MSVYTRVDRHDIQQFLAAYAVGGWRSHQGIEAGIENTNYFLNTTSGEFVLTIFEVTSVVDLDFFLALMLHLAEHDIASAKPIRDRGGKLVSVLHGKPAALVQRLPGSSVQLPQMTHCAKIGTALARMHLAVADFPLQRSSERGQAWRRGTVAQLKSQPLDLPYTELDAVLAEPEFAHIQALPNGVIHADLFRDNALFHAGGLSGIIDFYYAHNGAFIYDLAVAVADWCFMPTAAFNTDLAAELLAAYHRVRPLSTVEKMAWPSALQAVATRFWLSRLKDCHFPRRAALTRPKDPNEFYQFRQYLQTSPATLDLVWP
jgi:homoserine kinase type II